MSKEDAPDLARDAFPIFHIDDNTVPFLIAHGALDPVVPVDQACRFYTALRSAGVDAKYLEFADEGHFFVNPTNLTTLVTETVLFLDWYLKR
jgi:dipeptidyl aminopeptidase/acylaminoacyl peptidase